jgi:2-polyprenyl-6-hydroxyphenyl methylase/3-demethylubiquinone-9 3-methyltransferase
MLRFRPPAQTNVTDIYDTHSSSWWNFDNPIFEPLHAMVPARLAYLDRQAIVVDGKVVADVGAGGGYVAEPLLERGARVVGIDIAPRALLAAQERLGPPHPHRFAVLTGSAVALPLADASVDVVVSTDVLVHVPPAVGGAAAAIAEVARVLKPGGVFWFSTINSTALARLVLITLGEDLLRFVHKGTHEPSTFISPAAMSHMCGGVGLDVVTSEGVGPVGLRRGHGGKATLRMGRLPTSSVMWQGHAIKRMS